MHGRAVAVTATIGAAATTWLAVPLVALARGRSLDELCRARLRASVPARTDVVVPLRRTPTPRAAVPAPRPAVDDVRRVSGVG
jgi:hypothetical protein